MPGPSNHHGRKSNRSRVQTQKARDMQGSTSNKATRPRPPKSKRGRESKGKKRAMTDSSSSSTTSDEERGGGQRQRATKRQRRASCTSFEEVTDAVPLKDITDVDVDDDDGEEEEVEVGARQRRERRAAADEMVCLKTLFAVIY